MSKTKIQKMNQSIKKRWVAALRSGKFKQGIGQLCQTTATFYDEEGVCHRNVKEHCCLGVLYNIIHKRDNRDSGGLSTKDLKYVGLSLNIENKLIEMNDDKQWSFKRIAAYIDRYL